MIFFSGRYIECLKFQCEAFYFAFCAFVFVIPDRTSCVVTLKTTLVSKSLI